MTEFIGRLPTSEGELIIGVPGNTDITFYPQRLVTDKTGAMETAEYSDTNDIHEEFNVFSRLILKISSATAGKGVKVYVTFEEN